MLILKRGDTFYLRKRVPRRYKSVETRDTVWISLNTQFKNIAATKAEEFWGEMIEAWEARLAGDTEDAEKKLKAAQELADRRGFRYLSQEKILDLPVEQLVERVEAIEHESEAPALLGTVEEPGIILSKALEIYWSLTGDLLLGKSEDQIRRWRNPRIKAVRNLIQVAGDKRIDQISRDDMLDFRQWWLERIESGKVGANSANKDLVHLGAVLKTINTKKRLGLDLPLGELSFKEGEARTRPPFSVKWIRDKLLAPGALKGLNGEARAILIGMINTGYRPSEGAALTAERINLDAEVPHIQIRPDGRQTKSSYAVRDIPLLGVSLSAFRGYPEGFPRYNNNPSLSATVNKYLRENGLTESHEHTMYSLRHSFEDRMLEAGIDDRIRRDLFGHALDRERYGRGASLEMARDLLKPLAF